MKFVGAIPQSLIGVGTGVLSENINHPIKSLIGVGTGVLSENINHPINYQRLLSLMEKVKEGKSNNR
ncbi:hypothetical protein D5R40_27485 [Okeania hirsuta]|uniref:Uncharacterized protein n=1 Tax=Okeania hirsuta TaxID=1458930 RepID=A0A3N6PJS5_9CYAN|nr:hypothetical protein D5R40_27485 [Okeania hirsuta]